MSRGRGNCHVDSFVERPMEGEEGDRTLQVMETGCHWQEGPGSTTTVRGGEGETGPFRWWRGASLRGCGSTDGGLREHHHPVGSWPVMSLLPCLGGALSGGEHRAVPWARTGRGAWGPPVTSVAVHAASAGLVRWLTSSGLQFVNWGSLGK